MARGLLKPQLHDDMHLLQLALIAYGSKLLFSLVINLKRYTQSQGILSGRFSMLKTIEIPPNEISDRVPF